MSVLANRRAGTRKGRAARRAAPVPVPAALPALRRAGHGLREVELALATLPLLPLWLWNTGTQLAVVAAEAGVPAAPGWRGALALPDSGAWALGAVYFAPLLIAALAACGAVEAGFARARRAPMTPGWWLPAWWFALLVPAGVSMPQAAAACAFAAVFARGVFGGPGKMLCSQPLLAALVLKVAWPTAMAVVPVGGSLSCPAALTAWETLANGGVDAARAAGVSLGGAALGREASAWGATSALACAAGAGWLAVRGRLSWRTLAGGIVGVVAMAAGFSAFGPDSAVASVPGSWHLATGALAFGLAFLATDPDSAPLTRPGRWFLGLAAGGLAVMLRVLDPTHPDGTLEAVLLASLFAPLVDHAVAWRARRRRARRVERWP